MGPSRTDKDPLIDLVYVSSVSQVVVCIHGGCGTGILCVSQMVPVVRLCRFQVLLISSACVSGRMLLNDSKKGPPHVQYRRPYGCAVLAMSDVLQTISELKEEKDFVLKVYT